MYSGSISVNRITIGLPPPVRQDLHDTARVMGMTVPAVIRHILIQWRDDRRARIERATAQAPKQ